MTTKTSNWMTDTWAVESKPAIEAEMIKRGVEKLTTYELLNVLMRKFSLPPAFDHWVKVESMREDLEASLNGVGLYRSGNEWSFKKPASARTRKAHTDSG